MESIEKIMKIAEDLYVGTEQVLPKDQFLLKLKSGKKLKIKLGADPTAPDLHLGHSVVLRKLKQFQDLGHEVIFLIGDFTARIGDPTGRSKTRPSLSEADIKHNMKTYFDQVSRVLDPKKVTIKYNSEWLSKLSMVDIIQLLAKVTHAQITERDDFARRIHDKEPIGMHELLYPIFQAYDSVMLKADVELGGTDQTFNLLLGRHLQEQFGQEPQVVITTPLLEGLDGKQKMSKSLGNAVAFSDTPEDAFGKLMSISDLLMWRYFKLLCDRDQEELSVMEERVAAGNLNPMELKKDMAFEILLRYWSEKDAIKGRETFESLFQKKNYDMAQEIALPEGASNPMWIVDLLKTINAVQTSSEAKRLIESGAVHVAGNTIKDFKAEIEWLPEMVIKVGKTRIYRIK